MGDSLISTAQFNSKVRKKDSVLFESALQEISRKMELLGYTDYNTVCAQMLTELNAAYDELEKKHS